MKKIIIILVITLAPICVLAQQPWHFHYNVTPCDLTNHSLIEITKQQGHKQTDSLRRRLISNLRVGKITINDKHDTLTIVPWYNPKYSPYRLFASDKVSDTCTVALNDDSKYCIVINWTKGNNYIDLHYIYSQFAATTLPLGYNFRTKTIMNSFLNANIAYFFIWARTRFYKSKFIDPQNAYWGIGPYIGATTINDTTAGSKSYPGFTYGVNAVLSIKNIDLVVAVGAQDGFRGGYTNFMPYVGVGFGVKLINFFEPSNTKTSN